MQTLEEDGPLLIVIDFDNVSLLNKGWDEPDWEPPNVRWGDEGDTMYMMEYYATKDINNGGELLCDYREFAMLDSWEGVGLWWVKKREVQGKDVDREITGTRNVIVGESWAQKVFLNGFGEKLNVDLLCD